MSKNLIYVGIAALVIIAVVLGYKIYQQQIQIPPTASTGDQSQNISEAPLTNQATSAPASTIDNAERQKLFSFPGPDATEAERKSHSDLVNKLGNQFASSTFLDITGCQPNPIVYRVKLGGSFRVKNSDQIDHTLSTDKKTVVKAGSDTTISSTAIGDKPGDYGYGCDGSTGSGVGIIQLIP